MCSSNCWNTIHLDDRGHYLICRNILLLRDTLCWRGGRYLIVMDMHERRRWSIVLDLRGCPLGLG